MGKKSSKPDGTFLTSVADAPKGGLAASMKSNKVSQGKKSGQELPSQEELDANQLQEYADRQGEEGGKVKDFERASDIDFDADYSDDDINIGFKNNREVITYLHNLEDDNLFKVGVNQ